MKKLLLTILSVSSALCYASTSTTNTIPYSAQTGGVYTLILDGSGLNLAPDSDFSHYDPNWSIGVRTGFGGGFGYILSKFEGGKNTGKIIDKIMTVDLEPRVGVFNFFNGATYPSGRPMSCVVNPNEIKPNVTVTISLFGTVSLYTDILEKTTHPSIEDLRCIISYK